MSKPHGQPDYYYRPHHIDDPQTYADNYERIFKKGKYAPLTKVYKSDRTEGRTAPPGSVHLKTLCTGCKTPMDCYWSNEQTFGGVPCTAEEYMAKALESDSVGVYCDDCLEKMPDVKLEDLRYE